MPTVLLPLLVVLIIAGIFKGLEDLERHKADNKANSTHTLVFDDNIKGATYNRHHHKHFHHYHHHRHHYQKYNYYIIIFITITIITIIIIIIFPSIIITSSLPSSSLSSHYLIRLQVSDVVSNQSWRVHQSRVQRNCTSRSNCR